MPIFFRQRPSLSPASPERIDKKSSTVSIPSSSKKCRAVADSASRGFSKGGQSSLSSTGNSSFLTGGPVGSLTTARSLRFFARSARPAAVPTLGGGTVGGVLAGFDRFFDFFGVRGVKSTASGSIFRTRVFHALIVAVSPLPFNFGKLFRRRHFTY